MNISLTFVTVVNVLCLVYALHIILRWILSGIPPSCSFGMHSWSAGLTKARPGMHIDELTNKVVPTQAYYTRCINCRKTKLKKVINISTGNVLEEHK